MPNARRTDWGEETDVVVVGGGACGLTAALAARQRGVEVVLFEKGGEIGGNTALSTGSVPGAGTRFQGEAGIEDTPELMAEDILRQNGNQSDRGLVLHLCRRSNALIEWLVDDLGVELYLVTDYKHVGHSVHRLHAPASREGTDLVEDLERAARKSRVSIFANTPVRGLVVGDAGQVVGVEAEFEGQRESIKAEKVILGSNGFAANEGMVQRYCPDVAEAPYYGAPGNTGEGITWGLELGGVAEHMGAYQGYAAVCSSNGVLVSWTTVENGGIIVDGRGRRFGDETTGYSAFLLDVQRWAGGLAYAVFDHRIMGSIRDNEPRFRGLIESGAVKEASTLEELSSIYGLPAENLKRTLELYEQAAGAGIDEFGRTDFGLGGFEFPVYIVEVVGGLYHTQGGLKVNRYAQPLRADGGVIPNLYAGGGVAVGISGATPAGYSSGNGLLTALGLGRIAGEHAATALREKEAT